MGLVLFLSQFIIVHLLAMVTFIARTNSNVCIYFILTQLKIKF